MTLHVTNDGILLIGHFSCHNCDKTFSRQDTLKAHELKAHVNQVSSATKKKPASDVKPGGTNRRRSIQTARDNNGYEFSSESSDDEERLPQNPSKGTPSANNSRSGQRLNAILQAFYNQGTVN